MQYAATRSTLPYRRSILAPLVALVVGAAAAVGGYALVDDQDTVQAPDKVVFVDPAAPGEGVGGIEHPLKSPTSDSTPKVAPYLSHGGAPTSDGGGSTQDADGANPAYPHGPGAPFLHR
jgi:hypothetical protein